MFASSSSTMKTKAFCFNSDNFHDLNKDDDNDDDVGGKVIDVKEWMSLVLNPEKPILDKVDQ